MKTLATSLVVYLSLLLDVAVVGVDGFRVHGKRKPWLDDPFTAREEGGGLQKRVPLSSDLKNVGDVNYFANVTMGGRVFSALLDTGSSDLTVAGTVPNAKNTGKTATVNYAVGIAEGPIQTVQIQFEGFTIQDQAFISDTSGHHADGEGIIGLGPSSSSVVRDQLANSGGNPVLDRIFRSNMSTPNFITILLGRSEDPTDPWPGDVTIGELLNDFENVTSQPKLAVTEVKTGNGQHWQALLDPNGVIGPDGQPVAVSSKVKNSDKTRLNAVFDTGFSLSQVPKTIADAFYARVPGALYQNISGIGEVYTLPCDVELNVTFKFGGVEYPVHPLDTSISTLKKKDALGNTFCIGSFQPIISTAQASTYDMILGMSFLRNAYMLVNFGDFVDGLSSKTADPYIQLLPLTNDLAEAHYDFVKIRLDGIDNTANFQLLPATTLPPTESSTPSGEESFSEKIKPYLPYIIAGCATAALILIVAIVFCIRSSRRKRYRRLHDPAPAGIEPPFAQYKPTRRY